MIKPKLYALIAVFFISSVTIWGLHRGKELLSIPDARMDKAGYLEAGAGTTLGYKVDGGKGSTESDISFRIALSDKFEYGISDVNNNVYHHFQFGFDPLGTKSKQAHLAIGIKNIGWIQNTVSTLSATTVMGGYLVTSFQLSDNGAWIHAGIAESKIKSRAIGFGGIEFSTILGILSAEWDSEYYTFGYRQSFHDCFTLSVGFLTRFRPPDSPLQNAENFRIGISFFDNPRTHKGKVSTESIAPTPPPKLLPKLVTPSVTANIPVTGNLSVTGNPKAKALKKGQPDSQNSKNPENLKKSMSLIQKGNYFYYQGLFQEALDEYLEFIKLNPTLATGYINAGSIYMQLNLPEKAKEYWKKAMEIEPENPTLRTYLIKNKMEDLLPDILPTEPNPSPPQNED